MKKLFNHFLFSTSIFLIIFTSMPTIFSFKNITPVNVQAAEITPRADQIYWKYRVLSDGTVQKRRWNATRGYWVDPHWITVK